jgi:hypothetical protein
MLILSVLTFVVRWISLFSIHQPPMDYETAITFISDVPQSESVIHVQCLFIVFPLSLDTEWSRRPVSASVVGQENEETSGCIYYLDRQPSEARKFRCPPVSAAVP